MAKDFDCGKCYHTKVCAYKMAFKDNIESCNEYVPTADVEKVKRGRWIEGGIMCSVCGYLYDTGEYTNSKNYCPECGADMRGEADDL